jgi:hypothetical protein
MQSGEIAGSLINHPICGGRGRERGSCITHDHRARPSRDRAREGSAPVESGCAIGVDDVPLNGFALPRHIVIQVNTRAKIKPQAVRPAPAN